MTNYAFISNRCIRRALIGLVLVLTAQSTLLGEEVKIERPADAGIGFYTPRLQRDSDSAECALIRFRAADFELFVIDNGSNRARTSFQNLADAMQRLKCDAGTNGGFFHLGTFEPNGLMISQGRSTGQFDRKNWAEGIVAVRSGVPVLAERDSFELDSSTTELVQSGPWLVRKGVSQTGFTNDDVPRRRSFIATDSQGTWLLGHVSGATLKELAAFIVSPTIQRILPIDHALNLDGGPSSGFWVRQSSNRPYYIQEETTVRNFIGIRKK